MLPCGRPVEEAFDNGYLAITWEGHSGAAREDGFYRMHWLGTPDLKVSDVTKFPWKSNEKLPTEDQAALRA
jgi:hypothetical protein